MVFKSTTAPNYVITDNSLNANVPWYSCANADWIKAGIANAISGNTYYRSTEPLQEIRNLGAK